MIIFFLKKRNSGCTVAAVLGADDASRHVLSKTDKLYVGTLVVLRPTEKNHQKMSIITMFSLNTSAMNASFLISSFTILCHALFTTAAAYRHE